MTWRLGRLSRTLPLGYALSGGLLIVMGALTVALAPRGPGMANDGWQVEVSAALQHAASVVARALSGVPGWVTALVIFGALAVFLRAALRRDPPVDTTTDDPQGMALPPTTATATTDDEKEMTLR